MNTKKTTNRTFIAITTMLAAGVLTGCQYCEPLLMATLVIVAIYKGLTYSPFAESTSTGKNTLTRNLN
jgi:hypothetical protein